MGVALPPRGAGAAVAPAFPCIPCIPWFPKYTGSAAAQPPIVYAERGGFSTFEHRNHQNENFSFLRFLARFGAVLGLFADPS